MKLTYLTRQALLLLAIATATATRAELPQDFYDGDNLVLRTLFQDDISFCNKGAAWKSFPKANVTVKNGIVTLEPTADKQPSQATLANGRQLRTAYLAEGASLKISFRYRTSEPCRLGLTFNRFEFGPRLPSCWKTISPSQVWTSWSTTIPVPLGTDETNLTIVGPQAGTLSLTDLAIREIPPQPTGKERPLLVNGTPATAIYWLRDDPAFINHDHLAAQMLRYALQHAQGPLLPIREAKTDEDFRQPAIYIGKAAEKAGLAPLAQGLLKGVKPGGTAITVRKHQVGIAGHKYFGAGLGVILFLQRQLDIVYLSNRNFAFPTHKAYAVTDCTYVNNPPVPLRSVGDNRVDHAELRGFCPNLTSYYCWLIPAYESGHPGPNILPFKELGKTHPEFFALQKDGKRTNLTNSGRQIHYCNSNPDMISTYASRLMEVMRTHPDCYLYEVYGGDGAEYSCHCEDCAKLGNRSDNFIHFANKVAEITAKAFPDNLIATISYVENPFPPTHVKPHPNVVVLYTHYKPAVWGAQSNYNHPFNDQGRRLLNQWETLMPDNMGLFAYGTIYGENLNVFPAFHFNSTVMKRAADRHYRALTQCFYVTAYANGSYNGSNSFVDLGYFVNGRLIAQPQQNISSLVDWFFPRYYGPAATPMRAYFDLIENEPIKRNWAQYCEQHRRGFVTQDLAETCLPLLRKAEQLAGNTRYRNLVLKETIPFLWSYLTDVCRGRGNVTQTNFSFYAQALADFCRLARERNIIYGVGRNPQQWFEETAMLTIGKSWRWFEEPMVRKLMDNPEKILRGTMPQLQKATPDGFRIPVRGLFGGEKMTTNWMRKDHVPVIVIRRQPSGNGLVQTTLELQRKPTGTVILRINGIDNEKPERALVSIGVNGKTVFTGPSPWGKNAWSVQDFKIPASYWQAGHNQITLSNTTPEKAEDPECGAAFSLKQDFFWGWYMIRDLNIVLPQ